ncbi:uncharacterized protein G6M90_00g097320 [Metarhizium brunneum]|uniref:Phosphoribosyltransferase domain-containing protein n=1 Tax=Metarhizium brunneum TaxID=500148 RepID=A0A7D5V3P7_9HYPO
MDPFKSSPQSPTPESRPKLPADTKPAVIGLYGLPGSGKSFLLKELRKRLNQGEYEFYEGSDMISSLAPGGLEGFQKLDEIGASYWRAQAIDRIAHNCRQTGKTAIVTGHFMFRSEGHYKAVYTQNDMATYTHIIYLNMSAKTLHVQRQKDENRKRQYLPMQDLEAWKRTEVDELSRLCQEHGILFSLLAEQPDNQLLTALRLIQFCHRVRTVPNMARVDARVSEILFGQNNLQTMVVVDADKTISKEDTGKTFWDPQAPLEKLFGGPLAYSEAGFLQGVLLYEEAANEEKFERMCDVVASRTEIHAEFKALFKRIATQDHVGAVVVTCGIRRVWEKVLEREGLSQTVKVIGGARISDDMVVTAEVKARIISRLQREEKLRVWAIGDSPLDLPMLEAADEAIVVTGEEQNRSCSMDSALLEAIQTRGLKARQVLLPSNVSPRLTDAVLPQIRLSDKELLDSVFSRRCRLHPHVWHATDRNAARLLMSPTRDALVAGPMLRKAHANVGLYLAWEFLSEALGVEEYAMRHVQGHHVMGHRVRHERETTIVALMRGGEPLALGLNEALPLAMFVHADSPDDIRKDHVEKQKTVVLVDSVINSGKTLIEFIERTRKLCKDIRIVVVAGVVQTDAVMQGHALASVMEEYGVHIGALRLSENKFTGFRDVFAKRKIQLAPEPGKLIAAAHLKKLAPETDDDGYEKRHSRSYEFEEWGYKEGKLSNVVIRVSIQADKESVLNEYNDVIVECFGEGCRDKKTKKEKKSARKLFRSRRGVGSTFRRVFLRGA